MNKDFLDTLRRGIDETQSDYKPYIRNRACRFAENLAYSSDILPKTGDESKDMDFIFLAAWCFVIGYGIAVDGRYSKDNESIPPEALGSPHWKIVLADVPEATSAMCSHAALFFDGWADDNDFPLPDQYYSLFGFLKGMVAAEEDLEDGTADHFLGKKTEEDLMLEVIAYTSMRRAFARFAEDIYLMFGGESGKYDADTILGKVAAACIGTLVDDEQAAAEWVLDVISRDATEFLQYTCGGRSGRCDNPPDEELRRAKIYAEHYLWGFFDYLFCLLETDDMLAEAKYPQFGGDSRNTPIENLRYMMSAWGNHSPEDIELAIRHMKFTWDERNRRDAPAADNLRWQVGGLAYADGARRAREGHFSTPTEETVL